MGNVVGNFRWQQNSATNTALVALDICGFSRVSEPDQLLAHREALFHCVREAPIIPELVEAGAAKIQFIGDELRFAFGAGIEYRARKIEISLILSLIASKGEAILPVSRAPS